ncbi:hypothetical protein [Paenibacillus wenxiniae]|uniref:Normocyte-binding protein n=1 Tax=Paenibacillus wenxiniae TaxID=1636843 RepID=A0ABW4RG30_9BACL
MKRQLQSIMHDRIQRLTQLDDRRLMRQLVNDFLIDMVDHQEQMLNRLEQRVLDESRTVSDQYDIYGTVCRQEDWDSARTFLYPVLPEDVQQQHLNMRQLLSAGTAEGAATVTAEQRLCRLFLEMDTTQVQRLARSGRMFRAVVTTNVGQYDVHTLVRPAYDYAAQVEHLYASFQLSGLSWKTVYHPYLYKFVDVLLQHWEVQPTPEEQIVSITVDMEEFQSYQRPGWIPVWNVQQLRIKSTGFPMPALDRIHYEHLITLQRYGTEHGYAVDASAEDIRYIKRGAHDMTIVSTEERSGFWQVLQIHRPDEASDVYRPYPLLHNAYADRFAHHYGERQSLPIRTRGELERLVHMLVHARGVELVDVQTETSSSASASLSPSSESHVLDWNEFLGDHIRPDAHRPLLTLSFRQQQAQALPAFLQQDQLQYVIAELQRRLPEYRCKGVWT